MEFLLIVGLILIYTFQSFFSKTYSDSYPGDANASSAVFTVVTGLSVAAITVVLIGFRFEASWQTVLLGMINALVVFLYDMFMIRASQNGPYSILMVFMLSGGILLPAVSSMFFGNIPSLGQWISMAVIIVAIYLVSRKTGEQKVSGIVFFLFCVGLFIANGAYGALFDIQQRLTGEAEKEEMVIVSFAFAALISAVYLLASRKKRFPGDFRQNKKSGGFLVLCSLIKAGAINLMVYILPLVNVTVLYTFDNAGVLLLSVLASCVFFKEKLSAWNIVGCVLTGLGLVGMTVF